MIQVQDGCGGIPVVAGDPFRPFGHRRGDLPGRGCIFSIEAAAGTTGGVLGRSLASLRDFVDTTLADVRVGANVQRRVAIRVGTFLKDVAVAAGLQADYRHVLFEMTPAFLSLRIRSFWARP